MLRCKFERLEQGRFGREVARKAIISNTYLSYIERGRLIPSERELKGIAKALGWTDDPARLLDQVVLS